MLRAGMLATISLSGTLANQRHYDPLESLRSLGAGVGGAVRAEQDVDAINPRGQYVANLRHQTDVESSLVYMRARYYDPGTGRFVTEDPARDEANWFVYCNNDPVNLVDPDGRETVTQAFWHALVFFCVATVSDWIISATIMQSVRRNLMNDLVLFLAAAFGEVMMADGKPLNAKALAKAMKRDMLKGFFVGTSSGVLMGFLMGRNAGLMMAEIFYIDHWEELP